MPRTQRPNDDLDPEVVAAALEEVHEDLRAEEAAAAFFAAQAKSGEGEEGEAVLDEEEAEPVLGDAAVEDSGESDDSSAEEAAGDGEGDGGSGSEEAEAEEAPALVRLNSADRRPTTAGGSTVLTS